MYTRNFWLTAFERGVRTFAQALLSVLIVGETGFMDVDWQQSLSVAGVAFVASVLMSIAATGVGDHGTASFVREDSEA
jgi:hypothetical protein